MDDTYIKTYCSRDTTSLKELIDILKSLNIEEINGEKVDDLSKSKICDFLTLEYYQNDVIFSEANCSPDRNFDYILRNLEKTIPKGFERFAIPVINKDIKYISQYCNNLPTKMVRYIIGPYLYREYKINDVNVALFGEGHFGSNLLPVLNNKISLIFPFFLESIVKQRKHITYDLFTEKPFVPSNGEPRNQYVEDYCYVIQSIINALFEDCFNKNCQYSNLRTHYVDYRNMISEEIDGIILEIEDGDSNTMYEKTDLINMIDEFIKVDIKLQKQISLSYFENEINKYIKDKISLFKSNAINHNPDSDADSDAKSELLLLFDDLSVLVMDIYCISRMFKKTIPINNVICYTGSFHTKAYMDFIENYLHFTPILSYGDVSSKTDIIPLSKTHIDVSQLNDISTTKSFLF